jgi:MFS family permease
MLFGLYGRATRNFLALLCLMEFVLFIDRVNLAAAAPVMQKDLDLGNIALGLAFSAFNYSYAPFQLVGGWFADRFGARRTLTVCGLAWSITTMATGAVRGLGSLFAVRLVLGMGEGATLPAANRALSNWTSLASRGKAVGITHSAGRLGAGAAAPIVVLLITWFSWRFSFVALGILSALWAAVWWRYFHEDPRQHPGITAAELAALSASLATAWLCGMIFVQILRTRASGIPGRTSASILRRHSSLSARRRCNPHFGERNTSDTAVLLALKRPMHPTGYLHQVGSCSGIANGT